MGPLRVHTQVNRARQECLSAACCWSLQQNSKPKPWLSWMSTDRRDPVYKSTALHDCVLAAHLKNRPM